MARKQERRSHLTIKPGSLEETPLVEEMPRAISRRDVITESGEVKKLVRKILKDNGLRLYAVCEKGGFNYARIKQWLNSRKPESGSKKVGQEEIIEFSKTLGVSVRVTLVVSSVAFDDNLKFVKRKANVTTNNSVYDEFTEEIENGESN